MLIWVCHTLAAILILIRAIRALCAKILLVGSVDELISHNLSELIRKLAIKCRCRTLINLRIETLELLKCVWIRVLSHLASSTDLIEAHWMTELSIALIDSVINGMATIRE